MANSKYHYDQYKSYKNQVNKIQGNVNKIIEIKERLANDFYDEQRNVNGKLEDLESDLKKAVRHDTQFNSAAVACNTYKEKGTTADAELNRAICALENEIIALGNQKSTAETNMNQNYNEYQSKQDEERQARLDALKNMF